MTTDFTETSILSDTEFLNALRKQMLKFAVLQLSDEGLAEDAVQEALIGAMKNARSFAGKSALKTWVFAILKNKIADVLRKHQRLVTESSLLREEEENSEIPDLFNQKGFWRVDERPASWGNPQQSLDDRQFWQVFEVCLDGLPGSQARVFMMREFIELDSNEICTAVGVSTTNLNVMLHRARLRLRECLENGWFKEGEQPC
ncbi:MAG: RNA polymerase factor sigma-70 [Gammaproteobacteria bacterium]